MAPKKSNAVSKRHRTHEKFDKKRETKKAKLAEKEVVSNHPTEEEEDLGIVLARASSSICQQLKINCFGYCICRFIRY